jgi:hypothetical protein
MPDTAARKRRAKFVSAIAWWRCDRVVEVREVVDRWLAPEHRYFKVTGDDDATYILRHDVLYDRWELTMFERASRRAAQRPV